jgi:choline dehydrogenase
MEPCLRRAREAIGARVQPVDAVGLWQGALLEAWVEAGMPELADFDAETAGAGLVSRNVVDGARNNAAIAYLDSARDRPNLTVLGDTLADRVVLDGALASGAVVQGHEGERTLGAGVVVLAAGSYGSPAILMRSGIGPEQELKRHDISVVHALPDVGAELADHCRAGLGFALRDEAAATLRAEQGERANAAQTMAKWRSSRAGDDRWDVHYLAVVPPDRSQGRITTGVLAPRSRGRVGLRSRDPAHLPRVENDFLSDPEGHDLGVLTEGVESARALVSTRALRSLIAEEIDPGPQVTVAEHVRTKVLSFYHPTGTCRLGAVVNGNAGVHGLEGLHVADASIVPRPVRAGTYLTTLAVAERVAELLSE